MAYGFALRTMLSKVGPSVLIGASIIVASGLYVIYREPTSAIVNG